MDNKNDSEKQNRLPLVFLARFVLIALSYGVSCSIFTGIPFLFYHAPLKCVDEFNETYDCSNAEACANPFGYVEQTEYPQIESLVTFLNFNCDRRVIEATILTISFSGKLIPYMCLFFFPVPIRKKETCLFILMIVFGLSLCLLTVSDSTEMVGFSFLVANLMFSFFYGLLYSFISESSPKWFGKIAAAYANTAQPITMIIFICICYFFGSWQNILIHFTGIPLTILGVSGLMLRLYINNDSASVKYEREEIYGNSQDAESADQSSFEAFKQNYQVFKNDRQLRKNIVIWTVGWTCVGLCYYGCFITLNTLQGNLYVNNMSSSIFETLSSILAVAAVKRYDLKKTIVNIFTVIGICFCSCIFYANGSSLKEQSGFIIFLNLLPIIIAKIGYEMLWTVQIQYMSKVIYAKHHQEAFAFSGFVGILVTSLVPYYNYFIQNLGFSPFVGYGVFCLASAYYSMQFTEIEDDILKDGADDQIGKELLEIDKQIQA